MQFDYVIVGGGSAGCALASRLSENPKHRVCLLEAGTSDRSPFIHMPFGAISMVPTKYKNWAFETIPQKGLNGRCGYQPRGKVLGGSSAMNAMVYIRGHQSDYDDWQVPGWEWQKVLPMFKKSEQFHGTADDPQAFHGTDGKLHVSDLISPLAASQAFIDAGVEAGHRHNNDFNGADQEGVGLYHVTQHEGRRCSASRAYLTDARERNNLTILTRAKALKLLTNGKACQGVRVLHGHNQVDIMATKEVILSSGAFGSPQLLLLSGIGPEAELQKHGIAQVHELPGVGKNLQDHPDYVSAFKSPDKSLLGFSPKGILNIGKGLMDYTFKKQGLFTTNYAESGAFLKTDSTLDKPDIQLHFVIAILNNHGRQVSPHHGFSCHTCVLRPESTGRLTLSSSNPMDAPKIDPAFLTSDNDLSVLLKGIRMTKEILYQPAMDDVRGEDLFNEQDLSDDELVELVRNRADTIYHPVGTCKMGMDDSAVVDEKLRVRGMENLRVADASIMPKLIGGNTNAPSMMIGEMAAALIEAA